MSKLFENIFLILTLTYNSMEGTIPPYAEIKSGK